MRGFESWEIVVLFVLTIICAGLSYDLLTKRIDYNNTHTTVTYDCRLAEISVDYPVAVKQMCREKLKGK